MQDTNTCEPIIIPQTPDEPTFWLAALVIQDGQAVQRGQSLGRLEGKNLSQELLSPLDGYVVGLHALPGQIVDSGQVLCYICSQPSIPTSPASPRGISTGLAAAQPAATQEAAVQ